MTSSINFVDLTQKMNLLKELHTEFEGGNWERRERYIELRREVSNILMPLFEELSAMDMFSLYTPASDAPRGIQTIDALVVDGENSGIELSKKVYPEDLE